MYENIDFIGNNGQVQGPLAARMLANGRMDPGSMRPWLDKHGRAFVTVFTGGDAKKPENYKNVQVNAGTLRRDEWKTLDEAVLMIAEKRLGGVQDLVSNGLTYDLANGMGTTVLEYHDVSDAMAADLTMDGVTRSQGDRPEYGVNYLPLPIIHVDYEINARVLAASRNLGNALDTTSAERATRKVFERLENMLFTNTTYTYGGGTIRSYINHPDRNQVTLSVGWDDSSTSAAHILSDARAMKQASINAFHYGPWMLYIPTAYETRLDDDYDASTPGTTIRERIMKIDGIRGIKVVDTLATDNALLVEMNPETVRLVRGMGVQNVEWGTEGNMVFKYKVMTIQVPQIRSDQDGHCGVTHLAA